MRGSRRTVSLGAVRFIGAQIGAVRQITHTLSAFSEDKLLERFGYELDDIPARFFQRDLHPQSLPPQGIWRRYDLDRVRLGRLAVTLDLPPGAMVEMAYAERSWMDIPADRVVSTISSPAGGSGMALTQADDSR